MGRSERVHHRSQSPREKPVLRTSGLTGNQHQHRQPGSHRAQVGGR